ncbi:hypothetical protein B0G75_12057 [Paraburkholderia sp. BL18I3N2]|uniref:hypothetical protein n=1 Tax=unclassified Paraburkholderia TaxID=2615204 RepID=UPI000D06D7FA|nr:MULTISPECIES: hypothetical protein [unclassified Paraburkholderia]PRX26100.1 hypothetical protein B0G75_12057 [Paraburkholderia sp. BL18I3N2]PRX95325.1 hypothetical protein B0G73_13318 [Paraburkholderia sp. BL25I1N1]
MAITTVYQYRVPGQPATNRRGAQPHYATRAAIERSGQAPLLDTALELDESLLDANGFARLDYLTYRIHVRHGAYAGWTASDGAPAGARLQLMAGDYDARLTARVFNPAAEAVRCLQIVGANQRAGGDLWVRLDEWPELARFPAVPVDAGLVINGRRLSEPGELTAPGLAE